MVELAGRADGGIVGGGTLRRLAALPLGELASHQTGEPKGTVPAASLLPYVHQRYDDLSVLGAKS